MVPDSLSNRDLGQQPADFKRFNTIKLLSNNILTTIMLENDNIKFYIFRHVFIKQFTYFLVRTFNNKGGIFQYLTKEFLYFVEVEVDIRFVITLISCTIPCRL